MPFSDEAYAEPLGSTWRTYLRSFLNTLETAVNSAAATASTALSTAQAKYTKPAQGIPVSDLAAGGLVQTDGTITRSIALTQAAFDALTTKDPTTEYNII